MNRLAARFQPHLEVLEGRCLPSKLATLTVTNTADSGPGSLRGEIALASTRKYASDQVTIVFAKGLAGQTITLTSGELDIIRSLTIQGPGAGQLTISGGRYAYYSSYHSRVFEVAANTTVSLSGLTISNGGGYNGTNVVRGGLGGGILNQGTLTLTACTVANNSANFAGGGIYNLGTLTVSGCTVSGNSAYDPDGNFGGQGGGIFNVTGATLKVMNSTLSDNTTGYFYSASGGQGGGIYNAGMLIVSGSTLDSSNASHSMGQSAFEGGGIYNAGGGTATVSNSTLSGNVAQSGGGIYNAGALTLTGSLLSGNSPDNLFGPYTDGGGNYLS
ncbi:MAG TPA: hypothetical protein VFA26_26230 [Gemmataceae bacterium]|nr:hypothetical protein [Gemmataceae bacterium]